MRLRRKIEQKEYHTFISDNISATITVRYSTDNLLDESYTGQKWPGPCTFTIVHPWREAIQEKHGLSLKPQLDPAGNVAGGCRLSSLLTSAQQLQS